jgi:hypothetical protein
MAPGEGLQDDKPSVRVKVSVKRDCFANAKPLHDDEAGSIAERVRLVFVSADEGACFSFILCRETFNRAESTIEAVKERERMGTAVARAIQQERIRLEDNGVGGNQSLPFSLCLLEKGGRPFVEWVCCSYVSKETATINKDRFHESSWVSL